MSQPGTSSQSSQSSNQPKGVRLTNLQRPLIIAASVAAWEILKRPNGDFNSDVYALACSILEKRFDFKALPSRRAMQNVYKSLFVNGTANGLRTGGPHEIDCRGEVEYLLEAEDDFSLREMSSNLQKESLTVSPATISRIARKLDYQSYTMIKGQELTIDHKEKRVKFAAEMKHRLFTKSISHRNILFTDESQIWKGFFNRGTKKFWRQKGSQLYDENLVMPTNQHPLKFMIWTGIHYKAGLIGPFFCDEFADPASKKKTLNSTGYLRLLSEKVVPELKKRLSNQDFSNCWFQQDGAPIHTTQPVLDYLEAVFSDRIISAKTSNIEWPPHSPDLRVNDYWFWSFMKTIVAKNQPNDLEELKLCTILAHESINLEQIQTAVDDFPFRIRALDYCRGLYFERALKHLKTEWARQDRVCNSCNQVHTCDCQICSNVCKEAFRGAFRIDDNNFQAFQQYLEGQGHLL